MKSLEELAPIIKACFENAGKLIEAAKTTAKPGSYHIAYHLAALALEEIGKSSMVFMSELRPKTGGDDERAGPIKWIDDHERKLFWAIWLPRKEHFRDWKTIPESMDIARTIHANRVASLYVNPADIAAPPVTEKQASSLISLAEARLGMERLQSFRELDKDSKKEIQWFLDATDNPELRRIIFSKGSLDKQAEFGDDIGAWIKWLREAFEEYNRKSIELTNQEIQRVPPEGEAGYDDKFEVKIRLKSWSHSIRTKQLKAWNQGIDKVKLAGTNERNELMVTLTVPKMVKTLDLWHIGWQSALVFVTALNIGTTGFFWWYIPEFVSRYYERMYDIEHRSDIIAVRVPELKLSWGHLALKAEDLNAVGIVLTLIARSNEKQFEAFYRYFRTLGLMAKNDMFFQFEPTILLEFVGAFKDAMSAYGDWDGKPETLEVAAATLFRATPASDEFQDIVKELLRLADQTVTEKQPPRPVSLEDVGKAKIMFDLYARLKAQRSMEQEIEKLQRGTSTQQLPTSSDATSS